MFNPVGSSPQMIVQQVQQALAQVRDAMTAAQYLHDFTGSVSLADLTALPPDGPGMDQPTAQAILSAGADAYGHMLLYQTGTDPRNPPAGYVYGASQKIVLGSRPR